MRTRRSLASLRTAAILFAAATMACGADDGLPPEDAAGPAPAKSVASGLYISTYSASFASGYSSANLTYGVKNDSSSRTTGAMRVEYWASLTTAGRGQAFYGYRLATVESLSPLPPRSSYPDKTLTVPLTVPPDDQYTFALVLYEKSANCSSADGYCVTDSVMGTLRTVGNPPVVTLASNMSDLWWNPSESGWGVSIADHQTQMFAVWYTYRQDGTPTWFVMPGGTYSQGRRLLASDVYEASGPPWSGAFDPSQVQLTRVGMAWFDFGSPQLPAGQAYFSYYIGSASGTKTIQRQPFGNAATDWGNDLTDLYYDPAESGWGFSVNQHGNNVFSVWYTYDERRRPLFLVMPGATFDSPNGFTGDLYSTTGPWYGNSVFDPSQVRVTRIGSATVAFDASVTGSSLALEPKAGRLSCHSYFIGCRGKMRVRIQGGTEFNKWVSQQTYGYSAPNTPPPAACLPLYNDWSACVNGAHSRTVRTFDPPGCTYAGSLDLTGSCSATGSSCTYTYSDWGACQPGNYQTRTVVASFPAGCTGSPVLSQSCNYSAPACIYEYGPWSACVNGAQTRSVVRTTPAGCVGTPLISQACQGSGGTTTAFDGTYSGSWSVTVTVYGPDGSVFSQQSQSGNILVVIRNGAVTVDGSPAASNLTPNGSISFAASGTVGSCTYSGTMTASGGSGSVHCAESGLYVADGTWTLTRSGP